MSRLLEGRNVIVYGGGGGIGGAVARTFARDGAQVFLAGRTREAIAAVAKDIEAAGGTAHVAVVDALEEAAVDAHVDDVVARAGSVDVSFNLISRGDLQGTPLVEMTTDDMLRAPITGLRSNFLTARAAARRMIAQRSGVILHLNSASGDALMPGMAAPAPPTRRSSRSCATWPPRWGRAACACVASGPPASRRHWSPTSWPRSADPTPRAPTR